MSAAHWVGRNYFLGRVLIGSVGLPVADRRGEWFAQCSLPGAPMSLGPFPYEAQAREAVEKSAASRIKAMFGAGPETTAAAVRDGRELRVVARALYLSGVWTCDRPVDARALFEDLRRALNLAPEHAPRANPDQAGPVSRSDHPPPPEALEVID